MSTTTPSGRTRVPTMGDEPDIPADMMNMATDLEAIADGYRAKWKAGKITSRAVEGNGYVRITSAECFFSGAAPDLLILTAGYYKDIITWQVSDGSGALCWAYNTDTKVTAPTGTPITFSFFAIKL